MYINLALCVFFQERMIIDSKYCANDGGHSEIVTALDSAFWVKYSEEGEREVLAVFDEESDIFINVGNCMDDDNKDMHAVSGKYVSYDFSVLCMKFLFCCVFLGLVSQKIFSIGLDKLNIFAVQPREYNKIYQNLKYTSF